MWGGALLHERVHERYVCVLQIVHFSIRMKTYKNKESNARCRCVVKMRSRSGRRLYGKALSLRSATRQNNTTVIEVSQIVV